VKRLSLVITRLCAQLGSITLALLMFLTVADVFSRYLLNMPVPGTFELTEMSMVLIVFLALGLAEHDREHIALDLAYNYFSPGFKKITDCFVELINLTVVGAICWQLYAYSNRMAEGNYTTAVLKLPIHPFVLVALIGTLTYGLAIIVDFAASLKKNQG
jgi:TRAP-type C4-dicarboxylate transport system permease small subunit